MLLPFEDVAVGHWSDPEAKTGCTVILLPPGAVSSAEVRGGGPASRELDALAPDRSVQGADAVVLTGGSAYGLGCADGVMRFCEEAGRGVSTPGGVVPIVPALGIFDLAHGRADVRPTPKNGYAAAVCAGREVELGLVGAGTGATVGKVHGPAGIRPGGLGMATVRAGEVVVTAIVVVNAFGDIDRGQDVSGLATDAAPFGFLRPSSNTTIGCVLTNARLDKVGCFVLAQGAHDGLARAIVPPHTRFDGDAFVAASVGRVETHVDLVRWLGVQAVAGAIRSVG